MEEQRQPQQGKQKRRRPEKQPIEPVPEDPEAHAGHSKLARALGSVDYHSRHKGVMALTRFLQRKADLQKRDMLKIWKGLFYAFWHSDKAPVQAELADRLAAVLSDLPPQVAFMYFTCFMRTMRREWFGIDRLRLDKFLMLIRKFMSRMFKLLSDSSWNKALVTQYMTYLKDHVLLPSDSYRALGITYHVSDIFIPELKGMVAAAVEAGAAAEKVAVPGDVLALLLQPLCQALAEASDAPVVTRIREGVFDTLVEGVRNPEEDDPLCHLDATALASDLFALGAQQGVQSRNRQALYAVSSALERAQAKRQRKEGSQGEAGPSKPAPANKGGKAGKKAALLADQGQPSTSAAAVGPAAALEPATAPGAGAAAGLGGAGAGAGSGGAGTGAGAKKKRKAAALAAANGTAVVDAAADAGTAAGSRAEAARLAGSGKGSSSHDMGAAAVHDRQEGGKKAAVHGGAGPSGQAKQAAKQAKLLLGPGATALLAEGSPEARANGLAGTTATAAAGAPATQLRPQAQAVHGAAVRQVKSAMKAKAPTLDKGGGKKRDSVAFAGATAAATDSLTPVAASKGPQARASGGKATAGMSSAKKRVQINLRKNLYFDFGGPVPPAEIRTPQTARSKGGILKKKGGAVVAPRSAPAKSRSSEGGVQIANLRLANASHSADKAQHNGGAGMRRTGRAKAALFF